MRIGLLLPTVYASKRWGEGRIFAPGQLCVDLADQLVINGHQVFLYTSEDLKTSATVVPGDEHLTNDSLTYFQFRNRTTAEQQFTTMEIIKRDFEYDLTVRAYSDATAGKLDIIHSYHDFGAHYFNELTGFPTVYTIHDPLPEREDTVEYRRFIKYAHHNYISISDSQRAGIVDLNFVATVRHGIDVSQYEFHPSSAGYLIHFGRFMEDKGTDEAILVAKIIGMPIHLATSNIRGNRSAEFYDAKIAPAIDGKNVVLVGFMKGKAKSDYIGGGAAFVFPLKWEEPFGLVMIEAMACGTPVIAYNRGSVSEIVKDGVTGFIINPEEQEGKEGQEGQEWTIKKTGIEGLVEAVGRIGEIDRAACRKHIEENFTVEKMVEGYERVYMKIVNGK